MAEKRELKGFFQVIRPIFRCIAIEKEVNYPLVQGGSRRGAVVREGTGDRCPGGFLADGVYQLEASSPMRLGSVNKNRLLSNLLLFGIFAGLSALPAQAGMSTFQPTPANLWSLDHNKYYTWGLNWSAPAGEQIVSATLTIKNIDNWRQPDPGNALYVHVLDSVSPSSSGASNWVISGTDYEDPTDAFEGQGVHVLTYTDNAGGKETLTIDIPEAALALMRDGHFGFGFDPDCHYYNDGIALTINTAPTIAHMPAPGATVLCFVGLACIGARRWSFSCN